MTKLKNQYRPQSFNFNSAPVTMEKVLMLDDFFNNYCCRCISIDDCEVATILELGGVWEFSIDNASGEMFCENFEYFYQEE